MTKKKIGETLIEAGLITREQLENGLTFQKGKNKRLGKVLVELGYVSEEQVAEALSKQLFLPLIDCRKYTPPNEVLNIVPKKTAESKLVLPLEIKDRTLLLAMADPLDWQTIDGITFSTGLKVSVAVSPETCILDSIEKHYGTEEKIWDLLKEIPSHEKVEFIRGTASEKEVNIQSLYKLSEAPPIVKLVTMIFADAVKSRSSDIHIEPREEHVQVRYRIDGDLRNILKYPKHIQDSVISRVKIISNLDITNRRLPQDGRSTLRIEDRSIDLRISTLPSVYGEKIVVRLLDRSTGLIPLSKLGISKHVLKPLITLCTQPQGMILITGPTGSGKTTTMYALLQQLQSETENIISIEDPVEYKLYDMTQVAVNEAVGLTFAKALRSILRQDPDIIMVGEIRDFETAEIAARASLTGHLVLSSVHTNDTVATITRLLDIGLEPFLITSALSGVLAQRLVRRICSGCKVETEPPVNITEFGLPPLETYYKGAGCRECHYTGYRGQVGIYEFLQVNTKLKRLIAQDATEDKLWDAAKESGTVPLFEDAWSKIKDGITTVDEVNSKIPSRYTVSATKRPGEAQKIKVLVFNATGPHDAETDNGLIRAILEPEGYEITYNSENGIENDILKAARKQHPDIILLNASKEMLTPLLKKLRSDIRYAYTPVFAISDAAGEKHKTEALDMGIKDFVYRPINPQRLLFTLNNALKGH